MSVVEAESGRVRPLSGGLWTLFSWLRRDERSSSESLSSVGSDRTAASFAFLAPAHCARRGPLVVPPPGPPTDSYKKRVRDRNLRRHHDRDVTLLRKYGLHGFDAFSLPSARRAGAERERRAASELLQRRAHVPGKRRAPLPPCTLPRPRARKRPAPQPPIPQQTSTKIPDEDIDTLLSNTDSLPMNSQHDKQLPKHDLTMECRSEKCSKKEKHQESKEVKPRQDRSFLKQIFDNRKRHSAIETSSIKLLPSISELDKQAHEIIEKYKLKELEQNTQQKRLDNETPGSSKQVEAWICTRCLRKYNATVITCLYCLPLENALLNNSCKSSKVSNHGTQTNSSQRTGLEDREKLKEILKEMKDSLPKNTTAGHSKLKTNISSETESKCVSPKVVEAATLRIGSNVSTEAKSAPVAKLSSNYKAQLDKLPHSSDNIKSETLATIENVLVTQPEVLVHTKDNIVIVDTNKTTKNEELPELKLQNRILTKKADKLNITKTEIASKLLNAESTSNSKSDVITPLKVSSLFNPIYVPKNTTTSVPLATSIKVHVDVNKTQNVKIKNETSTNNTNNVNNESEMPSSSSPKPKVFSQLAIDPLKLEPKKEKELKQQSPKENIVIVKKIVETQTPAKSSESSTSQNIKQEENVLDKLDQHSRRRNLINQLEQSIAKGDERAAAEAAVKLAQLRLSCSVLSFSSQIVAGASTSSETSSHKANDSRTKEVSPDTRTEKATAVPALDSAKFITETENKNHHNKTTVDKQEVINQVKLPVVASDSKSKEETPLNKTTQKKDAAVQNTPRCAPSTSKETGEKKNSSEDVPILVWVEDKETTRGPVQIHVRRGASLGSLRRRAERALGLSARLQRWIVGRALCLDDSAPLVALAGPDLSAPFYLCLVESETKESTLLDAVKLDDEAGNVYKDLVKLEQQAFVSNAEAFECGVCMEDCLPRKGVVLRECVHSFCNECLSDVVKHSEEPIVACPAMGCRGVLQEREIKGLVTAEEYEKWLARGLAVAESGTRNAFHCRTRDCSGWALCEPGVRRFPCPVCKRINCVPCQAIHEGETCEQHRVKLESAEVDNATSQTDEGTRALLDSLIARGEALECPECSAIITKKWGCDWIKCSACKTEICWVTRGRRWGPAGRGDTSGGCRCGIDGKKCHPSCGYCH